MKACVLEGPKNYQIKDIPVPEMKVMRYWFVF